MLAGCHDFAGNVHYVRGCVFFYVAPKLRLYVPIKCYFMIIESYPNPWGLLITAHIYIIYIIVTSLCTHTHIINPQKDRTVIRPLLLVEASRVKPPRYEELLKLEPAAFVQSKAGNSGSSNPVRRSMGMTTDDEQ